MWVGQTSGKGNLWVIGLCVFFSFMTALFLIWLFRSADTRHGPSAINTPQPNSGMAVPPQANSSKDMQRIPFQGSPIMEDQPQANSKDMRRIPFQGSPIMEDQQEILKHPKFVDQTEWIRKLPEERRNRVNKVFKENAACVREKAPFLSKNDRPDPERIGAVMEECDRGLKDAMKAVLNPDEYKQFLNSLRPEGVNLPAS
jgi:hypothetical protein